MIANLQFIDVNEGKVRGPIGRQERLNVLHQTLDLFAKGGYRFADGHEVHLDSKVMQRSVEIFDGLRAEDLSNRFTSYKTSFKIVEKDTFTTAIDLIEQYGKDNPDYRPAGMNMANSFVPGGGVKQGCTAQEENCCYCSDMVLGIDPKLNPESSHHYPLPLYGGIRTNDVTIIRKDLANGFALLREPKKINMIGIAAFDLREGSSDRFMLGLPKRGRVSEQTLRNNEKFMLGTTKKVEAFFVQAAKDGILDIVPGAIGCGAFETPPTVIAEIFRDVLKKPNLDGRFRSVHFGILCMSPRDQANIAVFKNVFNEEKG